MNTEREAAIQKIKKLLRLSKSNNERESAAAGSAFRINRPLESGGAAGPLAIGHE